MPLTAAQSARNGQSPAAKLASPAFEANRTTSTITLHVTVNVDVVVRVLVVGSLRLFADPGLLDARNRLSRLACPVE
jgi:hypothetical protein